MIRCDFSNIQTVRRGEWGGRKAEWGILKMCSARVHSALRILNSAIRRARGRNTFGRGLFRYPRLPGNAGPGSSGNRLHLHSIQQWILPQNAQDFQCQKKATRKRRGSVEWRQSRKDSHRKLSEATGRNQRKIATKNTKRHEKDYLATDETRIEH